MYNKADIFLKQDIENILNNGYKDINPRPKYSDGTPAHTISINQVIRKYDISKREIPLSTLRPQAIKTAIRELLAIYQNQSNKISEFERLGCKWWKEWELEDGTIGKSYPYNLESHRDNEVFREIKQIKRRIIDEKYKELLPTKEDRIIYNIGYIGDTSNINNFTQEEIAILYAYWVDMFNKCYNKTFNINHPNYQGNFVHQDWHSFSNFLKDIRYIPQYFLAKEDNFKGWRLSKYYYRSNGYSKDTCVFLKEQELLDYKEIEDINNNNDIYRYELSRNQLIELLKNIKNNPYGRRHIMSFWNWRNIDKKSLVECAYETLWNIRNDKDGNEYLDMTLIQRSGDMLTASGAGGVNEFQYFCLMLMVANHTGYKPGIFCHFIENEQIYDRHIEVANNLLIRPVSNTDIIVKLEEDRDFFNVKLDDFIIENYYPTYPNFKLELGI